MLLRHVLLRILKGAAIGKRALFIFSLTVRL
jgi:hypothetical protein